MCAQFYVDEEAEKAFRALAEGLPSLRSGVVRPSEEAGVLTAGKSAFVLTSMIWGMPRPAGKGLVINARSESVGERPLFRDSLLHRRCVIPAGGFMEWDEQKTKVTFSDPRRPLLFLAGIFDLTLREPRFVVLTRAASPSVSRFHERMPLLLPQEELRAWLAPGEAYGRCFQVEMPSLRARQELEQLSLF